MKKILKDLNVPAFTVLIIYPLLLVFLVMAYNKSYGVTTSDVLLAVGSYYLCNISVGVGFHRLWSHDAFKTNKVVEFILMLTTSFTFQSSILGWASNHYKHHAFADQEQDPHSPLKFGEDRKWPGFFWSHIGWMLVGDSSNNMIDKVTMKKLGSNAILRFQLKYYWQMACFMNFVVPTAIGYMVGGDWFSAYTVFLFAAVGRAVQQHATFCINSLCHFPGKRTYTTNTSKDIWWFAPFILGENWHNFHHAFPRDYRNGHKFYHFDVHKWIIYAMSKVGLAWDLNITPDYRIEAKAKETTKSLIKEREDKLTSIQTKIAYLSNSWQKHMNCIESASSALHDNFKRNINEMQNSLNVLSKQLLNVSSESSERLIKTFDRRVKSLEKTMNLIYGKLGISF